MTQDSDSQEEAASHWNKSFCILSSPEKKPGGLLRSGGTPQYVPLAASSKLSCPKSLHQRCEGEGVTHREAKLKWPCLRRERSRVLDERRSKAPQAGGGEEGPNKLVAGWWGRHCPAALPGLREAQSRFGTAGPSAGRQGTMKCCGGTAAMELTRSHLFTSVLNLKRESLSACQALPLLLKAWRCLRDLGWTWGAGGRSLSSWYLWTVGAAVLQHLPLTPTFSCCLGGSSGVVGFHGRGILEPQGHGAVESLNPGIQGNRRFWLYFFFFFLLWSVDKS